MTQLKYLFFYGCIEKVKAYFMGKTETKKSLKRLKLCIKH